MTDSRSSSKYIKAIEEIRKLDKEPVGFSDFTTSIPSNSIPIRQNNIIIQLIIDLADKLDVIEDMYLKAEINMAFDDLDINLIEENFDSIVDRLIEDIDNLGQKQYLEKY